MVRLLLREEKNNEKQGSHKVRRLAIRDRISSTINMWIIEVIIL